MRSAVWSVQNFKGRTSSIGKTWHRPSAIYLFSRKIARLIDNCVARFRQGQPHEAFFRALGPNGPFSANGHPRVLKMEKVVRSALDESGTTRVSASQHKSLMSTIGADSPRTSDGKGCDKDIVFGSARSFFIDVNIDIAN